MIRPNARILLEVRGLRTKVAGVEILKGIAAGRREVNFPWQTTGLMRLVRRLPGGLFNRLAGAILLPRDPPRQ